MDMRSTVQKVTPALLLITGWALLVVAMWIRYSTGHDIPLINGLYILLGLGAFYLPPKYAEEDSGERLRWKLLWLLFAAGVLILGGELARGFILGGQ
jgi:hypothetical protein